MSRDHMGMVLYLAGVACLVGGVLSYSPALIVWGAAGLAVGLIFGVYSVG